MAPSARPSLGSSWEACAAGPVGFHPSIVGRSRRRPTRLLCGETCHSPVVRSAGSSNQSSRGPKIDPQLGDLIAPMRRRAGLIGDGAGSACGTGRSRVRPAARRPWPAAPGRARTGCRCCANREPLARRCRRRRPGNSAGRTGSAQPQGLTPRQLDPGGVGRRSPSMSAGAGAPVTATTRSSSARTARPPSMHSMAAAPGAIADQGVGQRGRRAVGGTGSPDTVGRMSDPAGVLHQRERSGSDHRQRAVHDRAPDRCDGCRGRADATGSLSAGGAVAASTSTNRTQLPGWIAAGGSASTSHRVAAVVPISCQPPGDRRGYTAENSPASATEPAGTLVRDSARRGTGSARSPPAR